MANCISLLGMVCAARENARIFENKERLDGEMWDVLYFYSSLRASCTPIFRGVPLSISHLNWLMVCDYSHEIG